MRVTDECEREATYAQRIEEIAVELEQRPGNEIYRKAWKIAARIVRSHKHAPQPIGRTHTAAVLMPHLD